MTNDEYGRRDRRYVIVKDDGQRSYWATLRMTWPAVATPEDTARYWVDELENASTYKTKVSAKKYCPDLRRRGVKIMTLGDAKRLDDEGNVAMIDLDSHLLPPVDLDDGCR